MMRLSVGTLTFTPSRVFCIGLNYLAHAQELKNQIPERPVIFMKPTTSLVPVDEKICFPTHGHELHYEAEVVVLVGKGGRANTKKEASSLIAAIGLGFDLTLRDLQASLKQRGLPWEMAKSFDQSAPIGGFISYDGSLKLDEITFTCRVNGQIRQRGNTKDMIFPIERLVIE